MKQKIIIFDIDGTLADCRHREKYLHKKPKDWKAFFSQADADLPIEGMRLLNQIVFESRKFKVVLCTGRHEGMRAGTQAWLKKHDFYYDELYMRKEGDFRQDYVVKKEMLDLFVKNDIAFVIDDRQQAVDMWRREGLLCLQCADGKY